MAGYISPVDVETLIPASEIRDLLYRGTANPPNPYRTDDLRPLVDEAEGIVDSHLQAKYTIPLTVDAPPVLKYWTKVIVRKLLWTRARQTNEEVNAEYEKAIAKLESISKGELPLGSEPEKSERSNATAQVTQDLGSYDENQWTRTKLEGF